MGLLLVCVVVARLSAPTRRKTWRRARPARWPAAMAAVAVIVGATYLLIGLLSWGLSGPLALAWPAPTALLAWIVGGQALLAFAEEVYYRGLLMSEVERLAPRLGVRTATGRRWLALGCTSVLFGMEHLHVSLAVGVMARQLVFTVALGILFGLLVMISANLHFSAGIHAWINWLLLGAAPHFVTAEGTPAIPSGTYIGLTLIVAFVLAWAMQRWRHSGPLASVARARGSAD